jgi:hypothetical protein
MEELRTTEMLDKEILEDARKKAHKILKTAEDTLAAQKRDWERKIQKSLNSIRKVYEERIKKTSEELFARLSLDKRRLRSETAEKLLVKAMDDFLRSLKRETLLNILTIELSQRLIACAGDLSGAKPDFLFSGMDISEANMVLKGAAEILGYRADELFGDLELNEDTADVSGDKDSSAVRKFPSVVINTKILRITASVENAAGTLMEDKRAELAAALLGEGILND